MSDKRYFHFTIGPVQGFVAQARRTRDFWAGSFLLSWLSGVAMQASIEQGAIIEFPKENPNYLNWLTGKEKKINIPRQGSIPNRFKAEIGDNFKPELVTKSVKVAWEALADQIFENDIAGLENKETKKIWNRQIENFWEISWAVADEKKDSSILDQRKNWRSYQPPPEPGVKCMMMDGWQELSGINAPYKKALTSFWEKIRNNGRNGMLTDFNKGESLCAIAFVKRRFVHHFNDKNLKNINMPSGNWQLNGWKLESGIPSVSYLAAVHWLKKAIKAAKKNPKVETLFSDYYRKAFVISNSKVSRSNGIKCIKESSYNEAVEQWVSLDGNMFFKTLLENKKTYPDQVAAKKVVKALRKLERKIGEKATPFYAVLMMDGDSLGKHMSIVENQQNISIALDKFTKKVPDIVKENNGFLIYAGGDDVLAILPLEDALECAAELKDCYDNCFAAYKEIETSLSGAIEYAHIKMPLTKVLHDAHDLLDNVAKERTGRDALAVRVWKPGGAALEWAQPWDIVQEKSTGAIVIQELAKTFRNANKNDPQFSNKFFFKIRDRFKILNPPKEGEESALSPDQRISLMAMEYINSGKNRKNEKGETLTMEGAKKKIQPLILQCTPHYRDKTGESQPTDYLEANGALLVRFLAQKGVRQ